MEPAVTRQAAERAKRRVQRQLMFRRHIALIGLSKTGDGYVVLVLTEKRKRFLIGKRVRGVPVQVRVSGPIAAGWAD